MRGGRAGPVFGGRPAQTLQSSIGDLKVETAAQGLDHPWSLAFLPDGNMLVTERPGRMRIVSRDGKLGAPLGGVPKPMSAARPACSTSRSTAASRKTAPSISATTRIEAATPTSPVPASSPTKPRTWTR